MQQAFSETLILKNNRRTVYCLALELKTWYVTTVDKLNPKLVSGSETWTVWD